MGRRLVAAGDDRRARVPVHPDRDHRPVRVQRRREARPGRSPSGRTTGSGSRSRTQASARPVCCPSRSAVRATALALCSAPWRRSPCTASGSSGARRSRSSLILPARAARHRHRHGAQRDVQRVGLPFGFFTIIVGHATFCVVIVYNNVIARLRRSSGLARGGVHGPRRRHVADVPHVTLPVIRTALLAGGLLAFALSFDEVIVTTFTAGTDRRCRSGSSRTSGCRTSGHSSTSSR